jgi:hypothetical protein
MIFFYDQFTHVRRGTHAVKGLIGRINSYEKLERPLSLLEGGVPGHSFGMLAFIELVSDDTRHPKDKAESCNDIDQIHQDMDDDGKVQVTPLHGIHQGYHS